MTNSLYISTTEAGSGKALISLGIIELILRKTNIDKFVAIITLMFTHLLTHNSVRNKNVYDRTLEMGWQILLNIVEGFEALTNSDN